MLSALAGCSNAAPEATTTVTFSISMSAVTEQPLPRYGSWDMAGCSTSPCSSGVSASGFSSADVTLLRVDVQDAATDKPIYVNFDLVLSDTGWTGTLPHLPKDKELAFIAHAYNSDSRALFSGSTNQTLTQDNETVGISLAPSNDGAVITLPRIKKILIPREFAFSQSGNISFFIEANVKEKVTYAISAAPDGGSFLPSNGSLTLQGSAGAFVSRYTPPTTVTTATEFTHEVRVTNEAGHSVITTFKTRVLPPETAAETTSASLHILFNPVINTLEAQRIPGTGNVIWRASVADDDPTDALLFQWRLTSNETITPAPIFTEQTNPTTLLNYTLGLRGMLTLEVSDSDRGKTTLNYLLPANQFPDVPHETGSSNSLNSIQAGQAHTCALFNNGSVRCWGLNSSGQLGYGHTQTIGDNEQPYTQDNIPLPDEAVQLATGGNHGCALTSSGNIHCWGNNQYGQLGLGHTHNIGDNEAITHQSYVNLGTRVLRIAAGQEHTCALLTTHKVRCWGRNQYGQLGYSHTQTIGDDEYLYNVNDVQAGGFVQDITVGGNHTCALLTTGKVRCWGYNDHGQLGHGHTRHIGDDEHPSTADDVRLDGLVLQISAGANHTCALLESGNVRCWGFNGYGQLGYGNPPPDNYNIGDNEVPASINVVRLKDQALQVSAGGNHTCALLSTGGIKCWGHNGNGQLGYGNVTQQDAPSSMPVDLGGITAYHVTTGATHTCALLSTGQASCWGLNSSGQLGYGHLVAIGDDESPTTAGELQLLAP
jgi:alpha-tubulin suppressor-like RCC1 family protein